MGKVRNRVTNNSSIKIRIKFKIKINNNKKIRIRIDSLNISKKMRKMSI
jgi:hypothetical protein